MGSYRGNESYTKPLEKIAVTRAVTKRLKAQGKDCCETSEKENEKGRSGPAPPSLFADLDKMKEDMKRKEIYSVTNFYWEVGIWQKIARSALFEQVTIGVIILNALWMAIDCDHNSADTLLDADLQFQIAENVFCLYFSVELSARFMAFKKKRNCLRDGWFVFDSVLVTLMVVETWVMTAVFLAGSSGGGSPLGSVSVLRLFRLARLSRLLRLLRSMPELLILVKGMVAAMRSVGFVLLLLLLMMYVFSIAFVQLLRDTESGSEYFSWILHSMYTLLVAGTFMDNITVVSTAIGADNMVCGGLFFTFVGLSALTILNMLIGVLCEVVKSVADCEKEGMLIQYVTSRFQVIWNELDFDGTGTLSKNEFLSIMHNEEAWEALEDVGVDPMSLVKLVDLIFESDDEDDTGEQGQLTFSEFMEVILTFRGSNTATVKDMTDLRKWLDAHTQKQIDRQLEATEQMVKNMLAKTELMIKSMVGIGMCDTLS